MRRLLLSTALLLTALPARAADGWLSWRGPFQDGHSAETGLPDTFRPGAPNERFSLELPGRGTPVIADGRLFTMAYRGHGADVREMLVAMDAETGKLAWEYPFDDFLSDTVYDRYALSSPTVDAGTGNVYAFGSPGIVAGFTRDGQLLWQHSMMEEFGRLTTTNGRTGAPLVVGDLVVVRGLTSNWGGQSAARDRFYAFDKHTGVLQWSSTPGDVPQDNSFSLPVVTEEGGKRVMYAGLGSGELAAIDVRTGDPLWRMPIASNGINASVVLFEGHVIVVHGGANLDASTLGRMVSLDPNARSDAKTVENMLVLGKSAETWRLDQSSFSSSPVLADGVVYLSNDTGELVAIDAKTGKVLWSKKLAVDQIHASPLYADGKLYVPFSDGSFWIVKPSRTGVKVLSQTKLAGVCLGAPSAWNGKVYVQTTEKLYAFGTRGDNPKRPKPLEKPPEPKPGPVTRLMAIPPEVLVVPGVKVPVTLARLDANGVVAGKAEGATWKPWIPPTAKVKSNLDATFEGNTLVAGTKSSAGAFEATDGKLTATLRGRLVAALPMSEDFESYVPSEPDPLENTQKFAWPPLAWIGGRAGWDVREAHGSRVLAKTLGNILFQRAQTFIGLPTMHDYTVAADVLTDQKGRSRADVGVIDQRYRIQLKGNAQVLEVSSNDERVRVGTEFKWAPGTWYRLVGRVDRKDDGSGVVRAKAWKKGDPEPAGWTLEVPLARVHAMGSPGVYALSPQNMVKAYVDNLTVTPNAGSGK